MFIQSNSIQTIKENIMTYFNGTPGTNTYIIQMTNSTKTYQS